jgi:hypothetical protein
LKKFHTPIDVKNNGVEFGVWDMSERHLGNIYVRKTGLVWCDGKKSAKNGKSISWQKFIDWTEGK